MGLPPVVVGLFVYLMLSRSGPFGPLGWLFTPKAMIVAQTIIALPLVAGLTLTAVQAVDPALRVQVRSLGATALQEAWAVIIEARIGVVAAIVAAFGGIISEVGAVMLVGGNIAGKTRVLTTAIVLNTRQGEFALAIALGVILLSSGVHRQHRAVEVAGENLTTDQRRWTTEVRPIVYRQSSIVSRRWS